MIKKQPENIWKLLFLGLLAVLLLALIGGGAYLYKQIQPIDQGQMDQRPRVINDEYTFSVQSDKENLTGVINQYLIEETQDSFVGFQVDLTDQVELHGSLVILGIDVNFALYFEPYVIDNGNVQLRADAISLGQINLPISLVLTQVARQVDFPDFVKINAEDEVINIELTNFQLEDGVHFGAERLDLEEDDLSLLIYLPHEAI